MTVTNSSDRQNFLLAFCAALLLVCFAYANHFQNSFHFDDVHCVSENPWIRDLRNIPKFFTDGSTFSTLPANRSYRPLVSTGIAIDYWLGHGLNPFWFHATTFVWFLTQLALMFVLFRVTLDQIDPQPRNRWIALFGATFYGLHPVVAETVNYVIQRSDIYSTLGVVAGLAIYARWPGSRRFHLYLLPVVAGILSKPPAIMFAPLLFAWIWLFEEENLRKAVLRTVPSALVCGALALFTAAMNPATYVTGSSSPFWYRVTQPYILLRYFRKFFIPAGLSADTDFGLFESFNSEALIGFAFVLAMAAFIYWCVFGGGRQKKELRPIAFGLFWFLIVSVPTSWIALAEVENDHRMYFPFVGLTIAACQAASLICVRRAVKVGLLGVVCAVILILFMRGTRERNRVWHDEDTLWQDVTIKSPKNGRGLMNYGLTLMAKGNFAGALDLFNRALAYTPNYYILEINLGIAYATIGKPAEAEPHFLRAISLSPGEVTPRYFYARWLAQSNHNEQAADQLRTAVQLNPDYLSARYLQMDVAAALGDKNGLVTAAQQTLARFPGDATATSWLARAATLQPGQPQSPQQAQVVPPQATADAYINDSLAFFRAGNFQGCIDSARKALQLKPDYAEAWNNVGACQNSLGHWDEGIKAELQAIRFKPDFQLAKNNLAWAQESKAKQGR
jgi:uncharacterized protein (TIGR02996 family)